MFPRSSFTVCQYIINSFTYEPFFLSTAVHIKLVITLTGVFQTLSDSVAFLILLLTFTLYYQNRKTLSYKTKIIQRKKYENSPRMSE